MTTTLFDLTRRVSRLINRHATGTTTALGTTTTLIDTTGLAGYPDDQWNGGTVWFMSGANAAKSRAVTDFADSGEVLAFAAAPAAIAASVNYEVADSNLVTYQDLRQAINLAIQECGKIWDTANEDLETVAGQWIYDLPSGVYDISRVEIVSNIGEDDEASYPSTHWEERQGQLLFDQGKEPDGDKTIRIYVRTYAGDLTADSDEIDDQIDEEGIVYMAARHAMRLAYMRSGKAGSEIVTEFLNERAEEAAKRMRRNRNTPIVRVRTG